MRPKEKEKKKDNIIKPGDVFALLEEQSMESPRQIFIFLKLKGNLDPDEEYDFIVMFNSKIILESRWIDEFIYEISDFSINLRDPESQTLTADCPLIFIIRAQSGKIIKDFDDLLNPDNRCGGNVDLFPLLLGEEQIYLEVPLVLVDTGAYSGCSVVVHGAVSGSVEKFHVPLVITMVSVHCLPAAKEGTVYVSAIGLDGVLRENTIEFGMSLSDPTAKKVLWASASSGGYISATSYNNVRDDMFIPKGFTPEENSECLSYYWNAMKRVLVDPILLGERLASNLLMEVAGVPRNGKVELRGRYMGFIDAGVLIQPGQNSLTTCVQLFHFNDANFPENIGPLLSFPPSSAKTSARESDLIVDEYGHYPYVVVKFDLPESLVPKAKMTSLFNLIGFVPPEGHTAPMDELQLEPPPKDLTLDARKIRSEGGALAVHKELSLLASKGAESMSNQTVKRTAANRLLMKVRHMLKQFPPGECSLVDWQDIVTGQHASCKRAVTASFEPKPPPHSTPSRSAAARCRMAGDDMLSDYYIELSLTHSPNHPRTILAYVLRSLENGNYNEARQYLLQALNVQCKNRYLLWTFGGLEFDRGEEAREMAAAALRIAVKGDYSHGTANAIGWAALHALHHYNDNIYAAFVASKKMRKSYELLREWPKFYQTWVDTSGEEEIFWIPRIIDPENPFMIAAAFFLCLRCYSFFEKLLECAEAGCAVRGSYKGLKHKDYQDTYYLRSAAYLLKCEPAKALQVINQGISTFGPSPMMNQMKATCLAFERGWDGACEKALQYAEKTGSAMNPALLLRAATKGYHYDPATALQRAARAHKEAPSPFSALIIGRVYSMLKENKLAERWAAVAVKMEPLLADGWAFLAILAIHDRDLQRANTMLRTARQVGSLSPDIEKELEQMKQIAKVEDLPEQLVKNVCFCDFF